MRAGCGSGRCPRSAGLFLDDGTVDGDGTWVAVGVAGGWGVGQRGPVGGEVDVRLLERPGRGPVRGAGDVDGVGGGGGDVVRGVGTAGVQGELGDLHQLGAFVG